MLTHSGHSGVSLQLTPTLVHEVDPNHICVFWKILLTKYITSAKSYHEWCVCHALTLSGTTITISSEFGVELSQLVETGVLHLCFLYDGIILLIYQQNGIDSYVQSHRRFKCKLAFHSGYGIMQHG